MLACSFLVMSLSGFGIRDAVLIEGIRNYYLLFSFLEEFEEAHLLLQPLNVGIFPSQSWPLFPSVCTFSLSSLNTPMCGHFQLCVSSQTSDLCAQPNTANRCLSVNMPSPP